VLCCIIKLMFTHYTLPTLKSTSDGWAADPPCAEARAQRHNTPFQTLHTEITRCRIRRTAASCSCLGTPPRSGCTTQAHPLFAANPHIRYRRPCHPCGMWHCCPTATSSEHCCPTLSTVSVVLREWGVTVYILYYLMRCLLCLLALVTAPINCSRQSVA
jgi:hypothetical protein